MKAYVKVVYSSEGRSPKEAEELLRGFGFVRARGTNTFETEVPDEATGIERLEALHAGLKGQGFIYEPSVGRPLESLPGQQLGYKERMARWRDAGLDTEELQDLLQFDVERFKSRGLEMMRSQLDRVAVEREREIREAEAREKIERGREKIMSAVQSEGGQTIQQLMVITGVDEDILTQMLDELVKKGKIVARQSGRRVAFMGV